MPTRSSPEGTVALITGLPASGKSTLARRTRSRLRASSVPVVLLDSDEVRARLFPRLGYGPRGREAFYAALAKLAGLLAEQGLPVLVAATANRERHRALFRESCRRLFVVQVEVPLEACARRDPKGLYARARRGELGGLPGVGEPFERPPRPDLVARGGFDRRAALRLAQVLAAGVPLRSPSAA